MPEDNCRLVALNRAFVVHVPPISFSTPGDSITEGHKQMQRHRARRITAALFVAAACVAFGAGGFVAVADETNPILTATYIAETRTVATHGSGFAPNTEVRVEVEFQGSTTVTQQYSIDTGGAFTASTAIPDPFTGNASVTARGKKLKSVLGVSQEKPANPQTVAGVIGTPSISTPTPPATSTSSTSAASTASDSASSTTSNGTLIFDAAFATKGFDAYPDLNPNTAVVGTDMTVVTDPKNPNRPVAFFDTYRKLDTGNGYPRARVTTGPILQQGQEYWNSYSFLINEELVGTDWASVWTGAFSAPWNGPSPLGMSVTSSTQAGFNKLHFSRSASKGGMPWDGMPVPIGEWVQVITNYKLGFADTGWMSMWVNTGPGPNDWVKVLDHAQAATLAPDATGGQYSSVGAYGEKTRQQWVGGHRIAQGDHRLVALDDYGTWNGNLP